MILKSLGREISIGLKSGSRSVLPRPPSNAISYSFVDCRRRTKTRNTINR